MPTDAKPSPDERAEKALVLARRLAERAYPPLEGESVTRISLRLVAQEVLAESAAALLQAEEALAAEIERHAPRESDGHCRECGNAICEAEERMWPTLATIRALIGGESR